VLTEVVVDAQRVAAVVEEFLAHRDACVWSQELERRRVGGAGGDDDGVLHRAGLLELRHHVRHRRLLLADGDVDADEVLPLLVDDRVDRDRGLAGLPVADDQLALAATDGIIESMALIPVCTGVSTGWRTMTPGAIRSIGRVLFVSIGPLPSIGSPSGFTTRPMSASPTGTWTMRPVVLTWSPSFSDV